MKLTEQRRGCLLLVVSATMLLGCGSGASERLIQQLREGNVRERCTAAHELAKVAPEEETVVLALATATKDPDPMVQVAASEALRAIGPTARPALAELETALQAKEMPVRVAAAWAVEAIDPQGEEYQDVLLEALRRGIAPVFPEVGRLGQEATWAVPVLLELVHDPRKQVRTLAAQTLGDIGSGTPEVNHALKQLSKDRERAVRYAAESALERLEGAVGEP